MRRAGNIAKSHLPILTLVISVALQSVSKETILCWTLTDVVILPSDGHHQAPGDQAQSALVFDHHLGWSVAEVWPACYVMDARPDTEL